MNTVFLAIGTSILYLIAYNTYGKFLSKKIFSLAHDAKTPAHELNDGIDYVPTKLEILFGHHYTSIAGTGPIVGPAIGIIWGWVPALIWVLAGSIFMGAVHDFGSIIISLRNQGKSVGDIAAKIISPRVRIMFLSIILLGLFIVIAIFCLVMAVLFKIYPQAILPIWLQIPIAVWLGYMVHKKHKPALPYSIVALILLYATILIGASPTIYEPISNFISTLATTFKTNTIIIWSVILLIYAFIASTLPVWQLLQPRDYINGHQLFVAMGLLALGVLFAHPKLVAPAINLHPEGAPPIWPFLFITIACGAISGFHSLVGSGTTAKQMDKEHDSFVVGYGGMLLESLLSVFAIIAVGAGIGIATSHSEFSGVAAFQHHYSSWAAAKGLGPKVNAFVDGSANMLLSIGIPFTIGVTIMGVFVASFAGTTLDTATRLQRYVISELSASLKIRILTNKYLATSVAVLSAAILAFQNGGKGGLILWPLFGASNQLLASLALLVITVYLAKHKKPVIYTLIPFIFMSFMTAWAMTIQLVGYFKNASTQMHLLIMGTIIFGLQIWMIIEGVVEVYKEKIQNHSN